MKSPARAAISMLAAGRTRIHGMPGQRLLHRQALHDDCRLLRIAEILWRQCTPRRPH